MVKVRKGRRTEQDETQRYIGRCVKEIKTLSEPEIGECVTVGNTLWNCTSNYTRGMYPRSDEYMESYICMTTGKIQLHCVSP